MLDTETHVRKRDTAMAGLVQTLINEETGDETDVIVSSEDCWDDLPTRRYMRVDDIESRYNLIYDQFEENDLETVVVMVNDGYSLPPFDRLPAKLQEAIFDAFNIGEDISFLSLTKLADELVQTG